MIGYEILQIHILLTMQPKYLYSRLEGGGARDNGIGLKTQLAGSVSNLLVPWSLQLR